jgi:hypothetical protein
LHLGNEGDKLFAGKRECIRIDSQPSCIPNAASNDSIGYPVLGRARDRHCPSPKPRVRSYKPPLYLDHRTRFRSVTDGDEHWVVD